MALGALSYYLGDTVGHSEAINPATAIEFLNLECKYGRSVTYGERLHGHIRTEFAFDIDELTDYAFAPPAYLRYIGFKVPRNFLEQAYRIFAERVARTSYERQWKHAYRGPGFKAHLLAILVFIIPKIGPASDLAIKIPSVDTEEKYFRSVNHTVDAFRALTGGRVKRGDYPLADQAYAALLDRLSSRPNRAVPEDLKQNIIEYYADAGIASDPGQHVNAH